MSRCRREFFSRVAEKGGHRISPFIRSARWVEKMVELSPVAPLELEAVLAGAVGEGLLVDVAYDGSIFVAAAAGGNVVGVQYAYLKQQHLLQCATEFEHCELYKYALHPPLLFPPALCPRAGHFPIRL